MSDRTVPFDADAICDGCGATGAYDFMGDYCCDACIEAVLPLEDDDIDLGEDE